MRVSIIAVLVTACFAYTDLPERPPILDFKKKVDYVAWWDTHRIKRGAEKDNAFALYRRLAPGLDGNGGLPTPSQNVSEIVSKIRPNSSWSRAAHPELADFIDSCRPQLDIMREAIARPRSWDLSDRFTKSPFQWDRPYLAKMREARDLIILQTWMKGGDGKSKFFDLAELLLRHADHLYQTGSLLESMMGRIAQWRAYESVLAAFSAGLIPIAEAKPAYDLLLKYNPGEYDLVNGMDGEWIGQLRILQYLVVEGKVDPARLAEFRQTLWNNKSIDANFDPLAARDTIDGHFEGLRQLVSVQPLRRRAQRAKAFIAADADGFRCNEFTKHFQDLGVHFDLSVRTECLRRGAMISLALLAHKHKHRDWPASLRDIDDTLGLNGLSENLIDPYSGELFGYQLRDGLPWIYSVSVDGYDNGGVHGRNLEEGMDYVIWPVQTMPSSKELVD